MKTEKFFAVLALTPGYIHPTSSAITLSIIGQMWERWANVVGARSDCFVGASVLESSLTMGVVGTNTKAVLITGERNPILTKSQATYRQSVVDVLKLVCNEMGLIGVQLSFRIVDSEWIDVVGNTDVATTDTTSDSATDTGGEGNTE